MRKIALLVAAGVVLVAPAYLNLSSTAYDTCKSDAIGKDGRPLAGAALTSFMTKCEADATTATCAKDSAEKKLAGAAKKSFETKCVKDATAKKPAATPAAAKPATTPAPKKP